MEFCMEKSVGFCACFHKKKHCFPSAKFRFALIIHGHFSADVCLELVFVYKNHPLHDRGDGNRTRWLDVDKLS